MCGYENNWPKRIWDWIHTHLRWVAFAALVIIAISLFLFFPNIPLGKVALDTGGIVSLILTVALIFGLELDKEFRKCLFKTCYKQEFYKPVIVLLIGAGIFGIWLSVRLVGTYLVVYLKETLVDNKWTTFRYSISNLFFIISYVLGTNLCFTLLRTFVDIGQKAKERSIIKDLVEVIAQTLVIGLITFIPRYSDQTLLARIGGIEKFLMVFIAMVLALLVILYSKYRLMTPKPLEAS